VTHPQILVEVCVDSLASALIAQQAGANRIELNLALQLDGLTPSAGLLRRVVSQLEIPVIAMSRPRDGGFCYSDDDWETLLKDADWLVRNGACGIAFGALTSDGSVDAQRCRQLRELVSEKELVFHKAFDEVADPLQALEQLVTAGIDRVMTSGLAATAEEGASTIARLVQKSQRRIEILPAGGIGSQNAGWLVSQTGCRQIHGSFRHSADGDLGREIRTVVAGLKDLHFGP
jgi:copper homeostasis protein